MATIDLPLTFEEVVLLQRLVTAALGDTRVEVHRTHFTPEFREELKQQENLLRGLLAKLPKVPVGA